MECDQKQMLKAIMKWPATISIAHNDDGWRSAIHRSQ